jgi:hypothetical protein
MASHPRQVVLSSNSLAPIAAGRRHGYLPTYLTYVRYVLYSPFTARWGARAGNILEYCVWLARC